jgi:hypothetical protein
MKAIFYSIDKLQAVYNSGLLAKKAAHDACVMLRHSYPQDTSAIEQTLRDFRQITMFLNNIRKLMEKETMKMKIYHEKGNIVTIESVGGFTIEIEKGKEKGLYYLEDNGIALRISTLDSTNAMIIVPETANTVSLIASARPVQGTLG